MPFDLENFDQRAEIEGATNAGYIAGMTFLQTGISTEHTYTDPELIKAWNNGFQKAFEKKEQDQHTTSPEPNEVGQIEE